MLIQNDPEISREDFDRMLRTIHSSGRKISQTVRQLLLMSSIRKDEIKPNKVCMNEVVKEAVSRVKIAFSSAKPKFEIQNNFEDAFG